MRMLKGNSDALNFDQLMAQATQVAKQQDASLLERARQKRREDEERRHREEKAKRQREEAQAQLNKRREELEKQKKALIKQPLDKKRSLSSSTPTKTSRSTPTMASGKSTSVKKSALSLLPEKKKPVDMPFEELMKKAKEQSLNKGSTSTTPKAPLPPKKYTSHDVKSDNNTPTLYHRIKRPEATKSAPATNGSGDTMSARERARLLISEPPKKLNVQKRDKRSIDDIQREIRHKKGIYSDDEDNSRRDPRLMGNKSSSSSSRPQQHQKSSKYPPLPPLPTSSSRKIPMSPPPRPGKRLPSSQSQMDNHSGSSSIGSKRPGPSHPPPPPVRRMPFSGRPLDPAARKPVPGRNRRPREEEEEDEELRDFVVDDDDEDDYGGYKAPRKNSYSDEISKIFRYDKSRYINDPVYSDDDMEADASDVLREEKRSERIARREDLIEEQKELERLKRRKKANA